MNPITPTPLSASEYQKLTSRAIKFAVCTATFLILIKLVITVISHSISLYASLMDSVFDVACSIVNLLIMRKALKPADDDHTFGHGKLEYFGILGQSIFIGSLAIMLIISSITRFSNPVVIDRTLPSIIVLIVSILLTLCLVIYQQRVIKLTNSEMIRTDQAHYKMDCFMNFSVGAALIAAYYGFYMVDSILAIIIGLYMLWTVIGMLRTAFDGLTDKTLPEQDLEVIECTIRNHPRVLGIHDIRTRQAANTKYIQFHLELDDELTLRQTHDICDEIETTLLAAFPDALITIHPEPCHVAQQEKEGVYQAKINPDLIEKVQGELSR